MFERDLLTGRAHWSPTMFRLYGLDPAGRDPTLSDEDFLALLDPEDREQHRERRDARCADPAAARYAHEFRIRRADTGELRWISSCGEIVRDAGGRPVLVRGTHHDITERRRAEVALAESEARFRSLAEALPGFVWTGGPRRRHRLGQSALVHLFGRRARRRPGLGLGRLGASRRPPSRR